MRVRVLGPLMFLAVASAGQFGCQGASSDGEQTAGSASPGPDTTAFCDALPVEQCPVDAAWPAGNRCAVITGVAYDEARSCLGERKVVGCGTAGAGTAMTCARDPSGVTWLFPDTRVPRDWTTVRVCPPYVVSGTSCR